LHRRRPPADACLATQYPRRGAAPLLTSGRACVTRSSGTRVAGVGTTRRARSKPSGLRRSPQLATRRVYRPVTRRRRSVRRTALATPPATRCPAGIREQSAQPAGQRCRRAVALTYAEQVHVAQHHLQADPRRCGLGGRHPSLGGWAPPDVAGFAQHDLRGGRTWHLAGAPAAAARVVASPMTALPCENLSTDGSVEVR
jgi:hypothetical protein